MHNALHDIYREGILADLTTGDITAKYDDDNEFHCNDGPAIMKTVGSGLMWYKHGMLHRTDGPATMMSWATEWWVNGELMVSWDHYQETTGCALEDLVMLRLKWGESGPGK